MRPQTPPAAVLARHLPALLARLRDAEYSVGPGEIVDLERLLARAACQGRGPFEAPALARVIAPVVCRSAAEQRAFDGHFRAWLAELPALARRTAERRAAEDRPREQPAKPARPAPAPSRAGFSARAWRLAAALLVVAVLALVGRWWALVTYLPVETSPGMRARAATARAAGRPRPAAPRPQVVRPSPEAPSWPLAFAVALWLVPLYYAWLYGGLLPAWLRRGTADRLPELDRLALGLPRRPLGATWRGIQALCDRERRPDPGLQVAATVRATVGRGGFFTPVYGHRPELPEYLALIDRRGPADHLARFAEELMARIEERGLATRTLFFSRDPRPGVGGPGRGFTSLAALAGQARAERLLVFSDAGTWLDPRSGRPWPGLEFLRRWRRRFLVTPRPEAEWGRRELALAGSGLTPFPLSDQGLTALADRDASQATATAEPATAGTSGKTPGVSRVLDEEADRWLDDAAPDPARVRRLLAALRHRLAPEGVRWLAACAVFAAVSWPVTCALGRRLEDGAGRPLFTEERLLELARLPWFRHGKMPPWLRLELIDGMERDERERVREGLRALLAEAARASEPGSEPEVAQSRGWPSERQLSRWLSRQGAGSPWRDDLFLTFLRGRRPSRLALAAPRRLRALIRDADRWSVLASALLALAGTLAIAVWYRLESVPVGPVVPLADGIRAIPMPAASALPEATIAAVVVALSVLGIALAGRRRRRRPAPPVAEAAVPGLMARISARRLPVLAPLIATAWVVAFIVADFAGSAAGLRFTAAHLAAALTLVAYFYLELGFAGDVRRRLDDLEARLDAAVDGEVVAGIVAFLRGRAATDMKRRLLRVIHAKVREPTAELVSELFELQHGAALEPRARSLLERVERSLEERTRQQLDRREAA